MKIFVKRQVRALFFRLGILCAIALIFGVISTRVMLTAEADDSSKPSTLLHGRLMEYDDAEGYFEFKAQGDRGSVFKLRMDFSGFYVFPQLSLSQMVQMHGLAQAKRIGKRLNDSYIIIPKKIKITVTGNAKYHYDYYFRGFVNSDEKLHKLNEVFTFETAGPEKQLKYSPDIFNWIGQYKSSQYKNDPFFHFYFAVFDRSVVGGDTLAQINAGATVKAGYTAITSSTLPKSGPAKTSQRKADYKFEFSAIGERSNATNIVSTRSWPLIRCNGGSVKITAPISWQDLIIDMGDEFNVAHSGHPGRGGELKSDHNYKLSYGLHLRPMKELKVYLEPVSTTEEFWMPTPGETRSYKLILEDPGPEDVEAIRFTLSETSSHPGIAINAGNHVRSEKCDDCKKGKKPQPWKWETFFNNSDGSEYTVTRCNEFYNECVLDSQPDIFFVDKDNAGYTMGESAFSEGLNYTIAQRIEKPEDITDSEYIVTLRIMDGAAASKLSAEVKVAGIWYQAQARGKTSMANGDALMLPKDSNQNYLQDEWEAIWGVSDPAADEDSNPKGKYPGDGLTNFEEYRGVWAKGKHHRLSPIDKTLFVYDYSGCFGSVLDAVAAKYLNQKIILVPLNGDEFYQDTINCKSKEYKNGDQYILNIMWLNQMPGLDLGGFTGKASHVGPPTRDRNTIMVDLSPTTMHYIGSLDSGSMAKNLVGFLGHEIGHNINLPHHGDTEGYRNIDGKRAWIACISGQHSGDEDCFMRYYSAEYFFRGTSLPQSSLDQWLESNKIVPFNPKGRQDHFCESSKGSSICGDAAQGRGNCLENVKIKSY